MTDKLTHDDLDDKDPPLDPAAEKIQARLRRMMMFSGLTLGLGIFAVFGAILYKVIAEPSGPSGPVTTGGLIALESGMTVDSAVASDTAVTVTVTGADGRKFIRRYSTEGGRLLGEWELVFSATPAVPTAQ